VAQPGLAERIAGSLGILRVRNVFWATVAMSSFMTANIVFASLLPNYFTDWLKLDLQSMGFVLSAVGLGALVGMVGLSALADRFGSRRVLVVASAGTLPLLWIIRATGPEPGLLFALVACWAVLNTGAVAVTVGRLTVESVSLDKAATATGVVMGFGEIIGGAVMPALQAACLPPCPCLWDCIRRDLFDAAHHAQDLRNAADRMPGTSGA
jgi:predicted MFS family arabinose efflux permease